MNTNDVGTVNYINPSFKAGQIKEEWISPQTKITYDTKPDEFVKENKPQPDSNGMSTGAVLATSFGTLAVIGLSALAIYKGRGYKLANEINISKFKEMGGVFKKGKAYIKGRKVTGTIVFCEEKGTKTVFKNGKVSQVFKNGELSHFYDKDGTLVRRLNFNTSYEQSYLDKLSKKYGKKIKFEETEYGRFWSRKQSKELRNLTNIEGSPQEVVAQGETVEQRVNNFLNNENYTVANPDTTLPQIPTYKREPHSYNTSLQDTFICSKPYDRTGTIDYGSSIIKDGKMISGGGNFGQIANLNINNPYFAIGKTPDGRTFVQYTIYGQNIDMASRHIVEHVAILSKNGEFTPVQKDLIKAMGSNTKSMKTHRFPMFECTREIKGLADTGNAQFVASEDVLFSGIHTMAKNTSEGVNNRFLSRLQNLKNGEVVYDIPSVDKILTEAG